MDWKKIREQLEAPFNISDIKWRVSRKSKDSKKGCVIAYVSNRAIQKRLDDVFGTNGWKNEFKEWGTKGVLCGISFRDNDTGEWITKWDGADNTNIEPTKGGISNSMKRSAGELGIGRYLYMLKETWVDIDEYGNFKTPQLPMWAYDQGELTPTHVSAIRTLSDKKGLTEETICAKYFKTEYRSLTMNEYKKCLKLLDKYKDIKPGEDPEIIK